MMGYVFYAEVRSVIRRSSFRLSTFRLIHHRFTIIFIWGLVTLKKLCYKEASQ